MSRLDELITIQQDARKVIDPACHMPVAYAGCPTGPAMRHIPCSDCIYYHHGPTSAVKLKEALLDE